MVESIHLLKLVEGVPALSPSHLECLAEAACVELGKHKHTAPVELQVRGGNRKVYNLHGFAVTEAMRRTYADPGECTEFGACGIAILLLLKETKYTVIERSYVGTGYDYRLGQQGSLLFQQTARLEISGIHTGTVQEVSRRTKKKIKQTSVSDDTKIPAVIMVVEFSLPMVEVAYTDAV